MWKGNGFSESFDWDVEHWFLILATIGKCPTSVLEGEHVRFSEIMGAYRYKYEFICIHRLYICREREREMNIYIYMIRRSLWQSACQNQRFILFLPILPMPKTTRQYLGFHNSQECPNSPILSQLPDLPERPFQIRLNSCLMPLRLLYIHRGLTFISTSKYA